MIMFQSCISLRLPNSLELNILMNTCSKQGLKLLTLVDHHHCPLVLLVARAVAMHAVFDMCSLYVRSLFFED